MAYHGTGFSKNVGHIPDYKSLEEYVYTYLGHNTTCKFLWEGFLPKICQLWPMAATYLQGMAREKTRRGSPWSLEHFTIGYESSSPNEGSFLAFQTFLEQEPKSFT